MLAPTMCVFNSGDVFWGEQRGKLFSTDVCQAVVSVWAQMGRFKIRIHARKRGAGHTLGSCLWRVNRERRNNAANSALSGSTACHRSAF